ncbi:MAG: hypothetical protein WBE34_10615 [Candidatus Nitrosopolaris sp.]
MATRNEHPERYGWWLNELESLGIATKRTNELNDLNELRNLTDNIKRAFYQEYKLPGTISQELESNNKYNKIIQCQDFHMNISESEVPIKILAKTCGSTEKNKKKVTYQFIDSYHSLCLDMKDIIYAELDACERLLKNASDGDERTVESEIAELKMTLDLLTWNSPIICRKG